MPMPARTQLTLTLALSAAILLSALLPSSASPNWSVSAWLTVDSSSPVPSNTSLISVYATDGIIGSYPTDGFCIFDFWRHEYIQMGWFIAGRLTSPPVAFPTNRGSVGPNIWYHWVAQKIGDSLCYTSNLTLVGCWSLPDAQLPVTPAYTEQLWPWRIENVQVFDHELSADELADLYADRPADFVYDLDSDGDVDGTDLHSQLWELTSPDPTFLSFFAAKFGQQDPE